MLSAKQTSLTYTADPATDRPATISQEGTREIFRLLIRNWRAVVFLMFLQLSPSLIDLSRHEDNSAPESGKALHRLQSAFRNFQGVHPKFREVLHSCVEVVA